jgi:hypothetical protein
VIKRVIVLFLIIMLWSTCSSVEAKHPNYPEEPVLITPVGQNPDGLMIKVVLGKLGVKNDYFELASSKDLDNNYRSVVMAVGVSFKGMGAAGLDCNDEINRTRKLVCEAVKEDCPIIFVYLGENPWREKRTGQLVKLIAPHSSYIIIKENSSKDKYFTEIVQEYKISLITVDNLTQLETVFKNIFCVKK